MSRTPQIPGEHLPQIHARSRPGCSTYAPRYIEQNARCHPTGARVMSRSEEIARSIARNARCSVRSTTRCYMFGLGKSIRPELKPRRKLKPCFATLKPRPCEVAEALYALRKESSGKRRLGWHWLWFLPLCLVVLLVVELHTGETAFFLLKLSYRRWSWAVLFSPSAYFWVGLMVATVYWPLLGLLFVAVLTKSDNSFNEKWRWLYTVLDRCGDILLPIVAEPLMWGSFPFNIDDQGVSRLRLISIRSVAGRPLWGILARLAYTGTTRLG